MKKPTKAILQEEENNMRPEYNFRSGIRGKHYRAMQRGYTITIHNADGSTITKEIMPKKGIVIIEPDLQEYFPDSKSVNKALRCLIPILPKKRSAKVRKSG